jgi:hypothetical protein
VFSHLKWPGIGQNELAGGPQVLLTATFWPAASPVARFHCQTFLPLFLFGPRELALPWPFSVPDGFCRKWVLDATVFKAETTGVVIEMHVKCPEGRS